MNVPRATTFRAAAVLDLLGRDDVGEEDVGIDEDAERETARRAEHAADHEREDPLCHGCLRRTWSAGAAAALLLQLLDRPAHERMRDRLVVGHPELLQGRPEAAQLAREQRVLERQVERHEPARFDRLGEADDRVVRRAPVVAAAD